MLLRKDRGVITVTQPAHAWLTGHFARTWGNGLFSVPEPFEAFCLAAEQHDVGWADHDQAPVRDAATGWPRVFRDVPATEHTAFWAQGVRRAAVWGTYPAILVSLHARTIYDLTFDPATASPANLAAVRRFLAEQEALRAAWLARLGSCAGWAEHLRPESIERNRLLLLALDQISLHACWGVGRPIEIPDVPVRNEERCRLSLRSGAGGWIEVDPWPFRVGAVVAEVEGRRLDHPAIDDAALRRSYDEAPPTFLDVRLRPA